MLRLAGAAATLTLTLLACAAACQVRVRGAQGGLHARLPVRLGGGQLGDGHPGELAEQQHAAWELVVRSMGAC